MNFWRLANPEQFANEAIVGSHEPWFSAVAVLFAIFAAWILVPISDRFHIAQGRNRSFWLLFGSFVTALCLWAMNTIALLSYNLPIPLIYDIALIFISLLPVIGACACYILLSAPNQYSVSRLHVSAIVFALGIGLMHFISMEALILKADMYFHPRFFYMSFFNAYIMGFFGLFTRISLSNYQRFPARVNTLIGSTVLGLMFSGMHFIMMRAIYFQLSTERVAGISSQTQLVSGIVIITVILFALIFIGSLLDRRMDFITRNLKQSELRFQRLAESAETAIFTFNKQGISYANPALSKITEYSSQQLLQLPIAEILGDDFAQFERDVLEHDPSLGRSFQEQFKIKTASGDTRWLHFSLTMAKLDNEIVGIASAFDISEQKNAELEMRRLAYSDPLTSLANRAKFMDRLEHHLNIIQRRDEDGFSSFVMLLDLDNFKMINDTYGHVYGDQILIEVSKRLTIMARTTDTMARLGGDEFILLFERLDSSLSSSFIAERIKEKLSKPFDLGDREVDMYCSIGIVELNNKYKTCDQVLNDVDIALYRAKKEDHTWWVLFDEELDARTKRARMLQPELKQAILDKKLQLYYQPIINVREKKINGFEALSRWEKEDGEKISPDEFIPLAEKTGMIDDIGLWVLEVACKQLSEWESLDLIEEGFYISVNVAPTSLNDERFFKLIKNLIDQYQIKPGQLKLELTERILVTDRDATLIKLNNLIGMGCKLMIDDFGTGYSSLSYLHRLPVSTVKIDRSFVMNLEEEESTVPVVKTIIALAGSLGMNVISEGVETELQSQKLAELGSQQLQGYLFSRPMPAQEATEFLRSYNSKAN